MKLVCMLPCVKNDSIQHDCSPSLILATDDICIDDMLLVVTLHLPHISIHIMIFASQYNIS